MRFFTQLPQDLPLVVSNFCPITKSFTKGAASSFRRSVLIGPICASEAAWQGCGGFSFKSVDGSSLDEHLAPCRSGTKFLNNRYVR